MSLIRGDARFLPLQDGCVDCVVSSPPYFGLRDYGHAEQIGLEPTAEAYVVGIVAVFQELRRVLKDAGTVWLNLGDSYGANHRWGGENGVSTKQWSNRGSRVFQRPDVSANSRGTKNLQGIPWRVAFALQADGWYLRSDIIWAKPNPMPESVTDRPTKSHEYLFLLTKSERYFYDAAAIAEPVSAAMLMEMEQGYDGLGLKDYESAGVQNPSSVKARIIANARARVTGRGVGKEAEKQPAGRQPQRNNSGGYPVKQDAVGKRTYTGFNARWDAKESQRKGDMSPRNDGNDWNSNDGRGFPFNGITRNRRTVWTIPTMPYAGAHFATMPEALVEPCILAGCPLGGLVLDPFVGSGTVVAVAERLGRRGVGVDLSYQDLAKERTAQRGLRFTEANACGRL